MPDPLQEIAQVLAAAEASAAHGGFAARAAAAGAVEIHALDRLDILAQRGAEAAAVAPLRTRAEAVLGRLEAADRRSLERLRDRIRAGRYTGPGLQRALQRHAGRTGAPGAYDGMDLLVQGLLGQGEPGEPCRPLEPDMVAYQPTPARAILDLVQRAGIGPGDVLVDLGSGLGQVALLTALLSGARARGIEWEPAYVDYARRCAAGLGLRGVEFIQADAREAPLGGGTVYYLFTPFRGALLRLILVRLKLEATHRAITLCTYGPCTGWMENEAWLIRAGESGLDGRQVAVFHPR